MAEASVERRYGSGWAFTPEPGVNEDCFISDRRAILPCGCAIFIGSSMVGDRLTDNGSRAVSCGPGHDELMERAVKLQIANLDNPDFGPRPAEEVAGEMLEEAWKELYGGG